VVEPVPRIVAMGGGGFSEEPDNPLLDDYLLSLTGRSRPRVCFLPTAASDSLPYVARFFDALAPRAEATWLPLLASRHADVRGLLLGQDVIYVGGGNTANMLAAWRTHGVDGILRDAWHAGIVLAGLSAGAICWFSHGVTDSFGADLAALDGALAFIDGSFCPHYGSEALRRPRYHELVAAGLPGGWGCDDGAALVFEGDALREVVSSRPGAAAYRVDLVDGRVREVTVPGRFLGAL